ncbi:glycosyltransferase [Methanolobus sediminis]|uniref:Glycosyltransferase n=1 Tax=Methanolobus sediminis TaxID=3072978 RepID=A0AA51YKX1_9EURY|nr:glycosyltransferase [Methanolobus sediminis]WMW24374.1 glycosyltransferase [Methanolobus sediminis]
MHEYRANSDKRMIFLIFVCGEGLGHTGRCISLAAEMLNSGHTVFIGAYGYSQKLIEESGLIVEDIPRELSLSGKKGSFDLKSSIFSTVKGISLGNINSVTRLIERTKPDFVISDGYYSGIIAARRKKVPVCMIVNQSSMQDFFRGKGFTIGVVGFAVKKFYTWIYMNVNVIFVPDFAPPFTICGSNLSFPDEVKGKIRFCGPVLRKKYEKVIPIKDLKHPHVLCSIGGFGYRLQIFKTLLEAAKMDDSINYTLIGGPDLDYDLLEDVPENVDIRRLIPDPFPYYRSVDVVICTGGHGTITESLSYGLPVISFPDKSHNEQENNAKFIEDNGYGRRLSYSVTSEGLLQAIRTLIDDEKYRSNVSVLKEQALMSQGSTFIRKKLEGYLSSVSL